MWQITIVTKLENQRNKKTVIIFKLLAVAVIAVILFGLDLLTELGVASGFNYIVFIFLSLWFKSKHTYLFSLVAVILIVTGWYFSPHGGEEWKVLINRCYALVGVLSLSITLGYLRKKNGITTPTFNEAITNQIKRNVLLVTFLFVGGLVLLTFIYNNNMVNNENQYVDAKKEKLLSLKIKTEASLHQLFSDVLFLSQLNNSKNIFTSIEREEELINDFVALMKTNKFYDQVRFLNAEGLEKVRVNYNAGEIKITAKKKLQDKSKRPYFKETIKLTKGEIYTSKIDLNIEKGKIEIPYKSVIRVATVVVDENNNRIGVLVINYLASNILNVSQNTDLPTINNLQLLNEDGFWLAGVENENLFGFVNKKTTSSNSFSIKNPNVWNGIKNNKNGVQKNKEETFLHENFELLDVFYRYNKTAAKIKSSHHPQLIIVHSISNSELSKIRHKYFDIFVLVIILYVLAFSFIIWYFLKKQAVLKTMQNELLSTNNLFKETQQIAKIGSWKVDLTQMKAYWSDEVYRIHEVEIGTEIDVSKGIEFYHPAYRKIIQDAIDKAIIDKESWDVDAVIITEKGKEVWVRAIGYPVFVEDELKELRGLFMDINEIKTLNINLEQIVEKRTNDLKQSNERLASVNNELEMFSYSVSHDLKAPLRALQGFSENIQEKYKDSLDETGVRWLQYIRTNAERMDHLIRDILSFSKIGRKEVVKKIVDNNYIINEIIKIETDYYKIPVSIKKPESLPSCFADVAMMETVWQNILGNAFKYSSKKPTIEITINGEEDDENVYFTVSDKGAGFDMKYYDKLFGIFHRLHHNEEFEGTGVGLANVKRIIEKHGGEISANAELNKGATIKFSLPKS